MVLSLCALIGVGGCAPAGERPAQDEQSPAPTADTAASRRDSSIAARAEPDSLQVRPLAPTTLAPQRAERARLVRGSVEIGLDGGKYVPAEYYLVRLEGTRGRFESVTNSRGEFAFESVPTGAYLLVVLAGKDREVHRQRVSVTAEDGTVTLPHIHIPADSLRAGAMQLRN